MLGVYPLTCPVETIIGTWKWEPYLGAERSKKEST